MTVAATGEARATAIGAGAILLWSTLALLTTFAKAIPPFQLTALTFSIAGIGGLAVAMLQGQDPRRFLRQPPLAWAVGVGGLFGYHCVYFVALRLAPPVEASLVAYLWPLLIVLFSGLLPGERLTGGALAGAFAGLAGTVLLIGRDADFASVYLPGYVAALACAIIWATYSVLSRRFAEVPTQAVAGFCAVTGLLSAICHLAVETTVRPDAAGWLAILALGLGPVGAAFFLWDHGVKRGNIRLLGAASYATPLMSTLLLVIVGGAPLPPVVLLAGLLIVGGSVLASRDLKRKR